MSDKYVKALKKARAEAPTSDAAATIDRLIANASSVVAADSGGGSGGNPPTPPNPPK